jgi:hypothetical protein
MKYGTISNTLDLQQKKSNSNPRIMYTNLKQKEKEIDRKILEERKRPFYVMDECARVFAGLRRGYPYFSENVNEAKPIYNNEQFGAIRRGSTYGIERVSAKDLL